MEKAGPRTRVMTCDHATVLTVVSIERCFFVVISSNFLVKKFLVDVISGSITVHTNHTISYACLQPLTSFPS